VAATSQHQARMANSPWLKMQFMWLSRAESVARARSLLADFSFYVGFCAGFSHKFSTQ
jgi:hypothetical protein